MRARVIAAFIRRKSLRKQICLSSFARTKLMRMTSCSRALRHGIHRPERPEGPSLYHSPHEPRLLRAHAGLPHREVRRRAAAVDDADAGPRSADHRPRARLCAGDRRPSARRGHPCRVRLPQREARLQDPRGPDAEDPVYARRRRPRHGEPDRVRPHARRCGSRRHERRRFPHEVPCGDRHESPRLKGTVPRSTCSGEFFGTAVSRAL